MPSLRTGPARAALTLAATAGVAQALPAATWLPPVRRRFPGLEGQGAPGHVALTFDDGPDPASTPALLDVLAARGARATFFLVGERSERYPELVREIDRQGHELAVHGWYHVNFLRLSPAVAARQVQLAADLLHGLTGQTPLWFRPPYGALSASAMWAARRAALRSVLWTLWARDWQAPPPTVIVDRLRDARGRGGTVLLHESPYGGVAGSDESCRAALGPLLDAWREQGRAVGPLREHGVAGSAGRSSTGPSRVSPPSG